MIDNNASDVYYEVNLDQDRLAAFKRNNLMVLFAMVVLHIGSGFISNPGMYQIYVSLPYVFVFFPFYNAITGAFRLPKEKGKYPHKEVELSFNRIAFASNVLLVLMGVMMLGELIFMLVAAGDQPQLELQFLALEALVGLEAFMFFRMQRQVSLTLTD